jgi:hypothetical protein
MTKIEEMARAVYEEQAKRDGGQGAAKWDTLPLMFRFALKQTMRDALVVLRAPTEGALAAIRDGQPIGMTADEIWPNAIDAILAEDPAR